MARLKNRKMKKYMRNMKIIGKKMSDKYGGIIEVVEWTSVASMAGEIFIGRENDEGNCYVVVDLTNSGGCSEVTIIGKKFLEDFLSQYRPWCREAVYQNDILQPAEGWSWV